MHTHTHTIDLIVNETKTIETRLTKGSKITAPSHLEPRTHPPFPLRSIWQRLKSLWLTSSMLCFSSALWITWGVWSWLVSWGQDTVRVTSFKWLCWKVCLDSLFAETSHRMRSVILWRTKCQVKEEGSFNYSWGTLQSFESFLYTKCQKYLRQFHRSMFWQFFFYRMYKNRLRFYNYFCSVVRLMHSPKEKSFCVLEHARTQSVGHLVNVSCVTGCADIEHRWNCFQINLWYSKPKVFNVTQLNLVVFKKSACVKSFWDTLYLPSCAKFPCTARLM